MKLKLIATLVSITNFPGLRIRFSYIRCVYNQLQLVDASNDKKKKDIGAPLLKDTKV